MPYLIYPPNSIAGTNNPIYAIAFPDRVDEIIVEDLQSWGWSVVEHDLLDPTWKRAMGNFDARERTEPGASSEERMPSLREIWGESKETVGFQEQRGGLGRGRSLIRRIRTRRGRAEATQRSTRSASRGRAMVRTMLRKLDCSRANRRANDIESHSRNGDDRERQDAPGILVSHTIKDFGEENIQSLENERNTTQHEGEIKTERNDCGRAPDGIWRGCHLEELGDMPLELQGEGGTGLNTPKARDDCEMNVRWRK